MTMLVFMMAAFLMAHVLGELFGWQACKPVGAKVIFAIHAVVVLLRRALE